MLKKIVRNKISWHCSVQKQSNQSLQLLRDYRIAESRRIGYFLN